MLIVAFLLTVLMLYSQSILFAAFILGKDSKEEIETVIYVHPKLIRV